MNGVEIFERLAVAAFGMRLIAHDPFISEQVAADLGVELVSLDDVEAEEEGKDLPIDDVEIEGDDLDEDETFLAEEEEGDDDVADLIDGDLEDDEEV